MACDQHSKSHPCAFCGLGEPSDSQSHGICALCAQHVLALDTLSFLRHDGRKVAMVPVISTNITRAGWRATAGTQGFALLEFAGGALFHYAHVSRAWWELFLQAQSKGTFFATTLRAHPDEHPFTKIAPAAPAGATTTKEQ